MKFTIVDMKNNLYREIETDDWTIETNGEVKLKTNAKPLTVVDSKNFITCTVLCKGLQYKPIDLIELLVKNKQSLKEIIFSMNKSITLLMEEK